jgi:hypothetical protein
MPDSYSERRGCARPLRGLRDLVNHEVQHRPTSVLNEHFAAPVTTPAGPTQFRNGLIGRTRDSESRNPGSNPGSETETGQVCPALFENGKAQRDGARIPSSAAGLLRERRRRIHQRLQFSEVGMRQAGTVVTRCSLHVRLVPSELKAGVALAGAHFFRKEDQGGSTPLASSSEPCALRLQVRSSVFQTDQAGSIPAGRAGTDS